MKKEEKKEEYEDELVTSHSDDYPELGDGGDSVAISFGDDDSDPSITDQLYKSGKTKPNDGNPNTYWDKE